MVECKYLVKIVFINKVYLAIARFPRRASFCWLKKKQKEPVPNANPAKFHVFFARIPLKRDREQTRPNSAKAE